MHNVLINANLYSDSLRLRPVLKSFNKTIFKHIDTVYTGTDELAGLLRKIYAGPVHVIGDSRFDQVAERAQRNAETYLSPELISGRRVVVYGSVIESDLKTIVEGIAEAEPGMNALHVVVPHETKERDLIIWEVEFYRHKIKTIRKTEIDQYAGESVLIWDSVGQLADLYQHAWLAYIGAGFSTGVHSVTEPAVYKVPSAHGPKYDILAEAIELVQLNLSTVVRSPQDLKDFLLLDDAEIDRRSREIAKYVQGRLGASDRFLQQEFPLKFS